LGGAEYSVVQKFPKTKSRATAKNGCATTATAKNGCATTAVEISVREDA